MLLTATWQSAVLAAIVLLITLAFRERLAPRFRYLLWCVVLLRLALPILPATPWGVLPNQNSIVKPAIVNQSRDSHGAVAPQWTPPLENTAPSFPESPMIHPVVDTPVQQETQVVSSQNVTLRAVIHDHGHFIALAVWLLGVIMLGIRYVCDELRLWRQSRYWKPVENANLLAAFDSCRKQLGIRRRVALLAVQHGIGAASTGTIFPKVLLSEQAILNPNMSQLRLVLLHELVHLKRFDPLVLRVSVILSVIHWLNPVVWLVSSRLQRDRELACDAAVLHILDSHDSTGTTKKDYGEAVLTFATHFSRSGHEHLPGLVGLFPKHAIARRIEMILNYKKSNIFYAIFGVLLVLTVAAFGLTRAQTQKSKVDLPQVVDEVKSKSDETSTDVDSSIDSGFAVASAMPETTDKERVAKFQAFYYLLYPPKNQVTKDKIRNEQLRVAQTIQQKGIRAAELLKVAREYGDEGAWTKYMEIVDLLESPFRELGIAYYHATQDMKDGNMDMAKKRIQDFEKQIKRMPEGFEQATAALFCFISLGKLGLSEEIVQYVNSAFKGGGVGLSGDKEEKHGFYVHNEFTDAIAETANFLIDHDEKDKAFDLALGLYKINCGNPGQIMNRVIEQYVKDDQIDKALELTKKIKTTLGRDTQWESYSIFQALLKKDEYEKALKIAQEVDSFNALVPKQMYFELMEYLLDKGEKKTCAALLDEALQKSAEQAQPGKRLMDFALFMKIAVQLNDSKKIESVMSEARKHLGKIMGDDWKEEEYPDGVSLERSRVHALCHFAEVLAIVGKTEEAKATFQKAIQQTKKVDDKPQANYALHGVADSQAGIGFVEDAFSTVKLISDKVIETEACWRIGNAFLHANDIPNAKRALADAQVCLKEINDSRVFGLVNDLERRIKETEKQTLTMSDDDALIFSKGQWTNEKTGEVLPGGSIVQGTEGTFRIEQEGEIGKVVKLSGYGTVGDGLYVKFSKGGNKIDVSAFPIEILKEFEEHGIVIGQDDVFVYDNGEWKNEKTGDVIPMGNLVAGTRGIFRLEEENGEGKITLLGGAGATGHGKYIRWSHGGNAYSGSRPQP